MEPGARPALNLDWSSVRFTSAAENGKVSGETGPGALRAVPAYTGTDWKLTLADSSRDGFTAAVTGVDGDDLIIKYSGAAAGENEMISAVIVSSAGAVTYYGNLAPASSADNSRCAVDVTGKMSPGDTLYVFNEQVNGDRMSDYAGPLVKLMTSVSSGTTRLTGGWYCVTGDVTVDDRITVSGQANLVLCDGAILRAKSGIELTARNMSSLTIWGQKEGAGRLIADGGFAAAGIGGSFGKSGGDLTINGGHITATGGNNAAGIGGGGSGGGGDITINGGTVEAKAGSGMAQAIGHGNLNKTEGSLRIHQNAKVTAGDASPGEPAAAANRADACRNNKWARIERCTVHSFENDICKWCGGAIGVTGSLKDGTLRYSVTAPAGALVIAARYDGGRMTDAHTVTLAAGDIDGAFTMKGSGTGYKLFLLDGATRAPLCPAWSGGA